MFRKLGMGAGAVLAVGLLAVGCTEEGDTILVGGGGGSDLSNNDTFPGSSIASNNVAADGGGLTPNDTVFSGDIKWAFNDDGSAIVVFQVEDSNGLYRTYGTNYSTSGQFTPPAELEAPDRDKTTESNIDATAIVFLNTAQHIDNDVRLTDGMAVILWDYVTFFQDPRLSSSHAPGNNTEGAHRNVCVTIFNDDLVNSATAIDDTVGALSQEFRYGFQTVGRQLSTIVGGQVSAGVTSGTTQSPGVGTAGNKATPACDVQSYGIASDGYAGQASWHGNGLPLSDSATPGGASDLDDTDATQYERAVPNSGEPQASAFVAGDDTSFVRFVWVQLVNSFSGGGTQSVSVGGTLFHGGEEFQLLTRELNLVTLDLGAQATVPFANGRNPTSGTTSAGTAPYPTFHTYNDQIFYTYVDASLSTNTGSITNCDTLSLEESGAGTGIGGARHWRIDNTGAYRGGELHGRTFHEDVIACVDLNDNLDGTTTVSTTARDLTFHGTVGTHDTTSPTNVNSDDDSTSLQPNMEIQNWGGRGANIFGADEGVEGTTIFYVSCDNTSETADLNIDRALCAASFDSDGVFSTSTINPVQLSDHSPGSGNEFHSGTDPNAGGTGLSDLNDPVQALGFANGGASGGQDEPNGDASGEFGQSYYEATFNRDGTWIAIGYIQDVGTSIDFLSALHVIAYQTEQPDTGGAADPSIAFDTKFSAPLAISESGTGVAITPQFTTSATVSGTTELSRVAFGLGETFGSWSHLPVNDFAWQGQFGLVCGLQSDIELVNILWEQSDATEDRLFVRQISIVTSTAGTPTLTANNTAEVESTNSVSSHLNFNPNTFITSTVAGARSSFKFLDGSLDVGDVESCDLGLDAFGFGGGIAILLSRITDNTTTDNDHADAEVALYTVDNTTTVDKVIIDRGVFENQAASDLTNSTGGSGGDGGVGSRLTEEGGSIDPHNSANGSYSSFDSNNGGGIYGTGMTDSLNTAEAPAEELYLYFAESAGDNGSSNTSLYTRMLDLSIRANANTASTALGNQLVPAADTGPGSAGFFEPTRLDHSQGGDVDIGGFLFNGTRVVMILTFDGHFWSTETNDGVQYSAENGAPNPALGDNDTSENFSFLLVFPVVHADSGCDILTGAALVFAKPDASGGDIRGRGRTNLR